jgi:hypothetical protein
LTMRSNVLAEEFEGTEDPVHHPSATRIETDESTWQMRSKTETSEECSVEVFVKRWSRMSQAVLAGTGSLLEELG